MPRLPRLILNRTALPPRCRGAQFSETRLTRASGSMCDSRWEMLTQSAPSALVLSALHCTALTAGKPLYFADRSWSFSGPARQPFQAADAFSQVFFSQEPSAEIPKGQNDYELSLGKITDTLRSDYPEFFERSPDFNVYDESISLEFGRPLEEPKTLARGKTAYCRALLAARTIGSSSMIRNCLISSQVCDGRPYGCALRVHWTCGGQVWLGKYRDFQISAVSYYSLAPQAPDRSGAYQFLAYRINKHTLDIMEIHPGSLRSHLLDLLVPQAEREPSLASQSRAATAGMEGCL